MSVSDEFLEVGRTLPETTKNQHHLTIADSWCLMYPEVALEDKLLGTESDNPSHDEEAPILPTTGLRSSSSMPSTSSESSLDNVIVVDARNSIEKPCSSGGTHQALETKTEFKEGADIAFGNSGRSEANSASVCHITESQDSNITRESPLLSASPMDNPKIQVMERADGYDPDRIPSSVFSRSDSLIPAEWSAASNESLFSIHVGNASFNREAPITSSGELGRSGELTKADELLLFSPLPTPVETDIEKNNSRRYSSKIVDHGMQKDTRKTNPVDSDKVNPSPSVPAVHSPSASRHSIGSEGSARSFAFPMCYYRWPTCFCCHCSCAICCCWNYRLKRLLCCFPTTILAPGAKISPAKASSHQQRLSESPLKAQNSGTISKVSNPKKTSSCNCFYCFSCFSCRSCWSCSPCRSCWSCISCSSCSSWFTCCSCRSCFSCGSCSSCFSCFSCSSYFSCSSSWSLCFLRK